ncbi:MAG: hypothetical protein EHM60_07110 [Lysobacterales bacterium]|jgi:hypothetical protein|nr:MAG: hypothetical protein EHM60_07110 [Xanthomonadales bacterium]
MSIQKNTRFVRVVGAICTGVALVACSAPAAGTDARNVAFPPELQKMTREVIADAASRTGLASEALVVERAEAVTWPDGALGCGKPGVVYTQALVPGYRVVIRAGEERLSYHANRKGYWTYCPSPSITDDTINPSY